jgi:hypothetical protein
MLKLLLWWFIGEIHCHNDEIVETKVTPSGWEQMHPSDSCIKEIRDGPMELAPWLFTRVIVTIVRCKECGDVRHIVTETRL